MTDRAPTSSLPETNEQRLAARRFNRLAFFAIVAGFMLLFFAGVAAVFAFTANQRNNDLVDHTYQVIANISDVETLIERSQTSMRGYLLVPDPARSIAFRKTIAGIRPALNRVHQLTLDNPVQHRNLEPLDEEVTRQVRSSVAVMDLADAGRLDEARALFAREVRKRGIFRVRDLAAVARTEEQRKLVQRNRAEDSGVLVLEVVLGGIGLLLLLVGIGTVLLVRRYTSELNSSRDRLFLLNTNLESAVADRTAELTRANAEIQRFAYIVSHDLRSPLVNVMGFTAELDRTNWDIVAFIDKVEAEHPELITDEIRHAAREDLPEAIGFIRSSTQKMDRLINAILTLSRQGRRVLVPELLPMQTLVEELSKSVQAQLEERGASLIVEKGLPDVRHDRLAVEQVMSNLIDNAVKYLDPKRTGKIVVRGRRQGDRAVFEVEDNGRGISENDLERIFELFRRSGKQDQPGEGIGLAHVRALAYRLGGTVTVSSRLGEGSTFRLDLPIKFRDEGQAS